MRAGWRRRWRSFLHGTLPPGRFPWSRFPSGRACRAPVRPEAPAGELPRRAAAPPIRLVQDEPRAPAAGRALRSHAPVAANDSYPAAHDPAPARASFTFELPPLDLLGEPDASSGYEVPIEVLQENAAILENVLWDFNVKGEIIKVHPGPVVTLYELEPAP